MLKFIPLQYSKDWALTIQQQQTTSNITIEPIETSYDLKAKTIIWKIIIKESVRIYDILTLGGVQLCHYKGFMMHILSWS